MIYDCCIFDDELDMLERRLSELYDTVDFFVIVEGNRTHTGLEKILSLLKHRKRFDRFSSKMRYIALTSWPELPLGHCSVTFERYQRNAIMDGLTDCKDDDVIIIADCDEIPDPEVIKSYNPGDGIRNLCMNFYYYNEHVKSPSQWCAAKILTYGALKVSTPEEIRHATGRPLENAGNHYSYFGGVDAIIRKIEHFSHQEFNTSYYKDPERIRNCIQNGTDLFERPGQIWKKI